MFTWFCLFVMFFWLPNIKYLTNLHNFVIKKKLKNKYQNYIFFIAVKSVSNARYESNKEAFYFKLLQILSQRVKFNSKYINFIKYKFEM